MSKKKKKMVSTGGTGQVNHKISDQIAQIMTWLHALALAQKNSRDATKTGKKN